MHLGRPIAALLLATSLCATPLCAQAQPPSNTPIAFPSDAAALRHPIDLSPTAIAAIAADKDAFPNGLPRDLHCKARERYPHRPTAQLLCTKLPLAHDASDNYLIIGVGSLRGAHLVPYWIVRQSSRGDKLIFKAKCDNLAILHDRFNKYRELDATWIQQAGANILDVRYGFDGKSYVKLSSQESHK
jgi:hypothetical protein